MGVFLGCGLGLDGGGRVEDGGHGSSLYNGDGPFRKSEGKAGGCTVVYIYLGVNIAEKGQRRGSGKVSIVDDFAVIANGDCCFVCVEDDGGVAVQY